MPRHDATDIREGFCNDLRIMKRRMFTETMDDKDERSHLFTIRIPNLLKQFQTIGIGEIIFLDHIFISTEIVNRDTVTPPKKTDLTS